MLPGEEDAEAVCLPTYEFREAELLEYDEGPEIVTTGLAAEFPPFPVPRPEPTMPPPAASLSRGCSLQKELQSFADVPRDPKKQVHFGQLLAHCAQEAAGLTPLPLLIQQTKKASASEAGKLSSRAFKATMLQPAANLPPRPKNAYQLFCADFSASSGETQASAVARSDSSSSSSCSSSSISSSDDSSGSGSGSSSGEYEDDSSSSKKRKGKAPANQ